MAALGAIGVNNRPKLANLAYAKAIIAVAGLPAVAAQLTQTGYVYVG